MTEQNTTREPLDAIWAELSGEDASGWALEKSWLRIQGVLGLSVAGPGMLKDYQAALSAKLHELVRAAYYRGYHAGLGDAGKASSMERPDA